MRITTFGVKGLRNISPVPCESTLCSMQRPDTEQLCTYSARNSSASQGGTDSAAA